MPSKFTESLELARELLKIYHLQGAVAFAECLQRYARLIVADCQQDPRRLNTRFSTVVFGMLSILFVNDTERIMRQEVAVTEGFINEPDPARKAELFVRDVAGFCASTRRKAPRRPSRSASSCAWPLVRWPSSGRR